MIGVNSQIETGGTGDGNVGIGFADPRQHRQARSSPSCSPHGKVDHAYLGVSAVEITSDIAGAFKLPVEKGLVIQTVTSGSGAAEGRAARQAPASA